MSTDNPSVVSTEATTEILERLVRIETRQAKLMRFVGLDTSGNSRPSPLVETITQSVTDSIKGTDK